jgi:DNA-binding NtrC family response regulator
VNDLMTVDPLTELIGESPAIVDLREELERIAQSDAKVLITGEGGVGQQTIARRIHSGGSRAHNPFRALNCAELPEARLEADLFGHMGGSLSDAFRDRTGHLEATNHGTLFLDEIGAMSPRIQDQFVRFFEARKRRDNGVDPQRGEHVDVRVISSTSRNLLDLVARGLFRADLFYRLNVVHLIVPPLRERQADIPVLIDHFVHQYADGRASAIRFSEAAMASLVRYSWPGNVRELEHVVRRLVLDVVDLTIRLEHLPSEIRRSGWVALRQKPDRRRDIAAELYALMRDQRQSFWSAIHALFVTHDITRATVRDVVRLGLEDADGDYWRLTQLFNLEPEDYRPFMHFLRRHNCHVPAR